MLELLKIGTLFGILLVMIGLGLWLTQPQKGTCREVYSETPISQVPAGCIGRDGLR